MIPGPSEDAPVPASVLHDPLATFGYLFEAHGEVARYRGPRGPYVSVVDPAVVRRLLTSHEFPRASLLKIALGESTLSADGEKWRHHRRLVQPMFEQRRVEAHVGVMQAEAEAEVQAWADAEAPFDMEEAMMRLTLRVVARALFSADLAEHLGTISHALTEVIRGLADVNSAVFGIPVRVAPDRNRRFRAALAALNEVVHMIVAERRRVPESAWPDDLLASMLRAGADEGAPFDDVAIRDEVVTMLVAGHETTAGMLTWTWARLALHPEVRQAWWQYVDGLPEGPPDLTRLAQPNPTSALLSEVMRLHPPVWLVARRVVEDRALEGWAVEAGTVLCIPTHTLHRNPRLWPDPERFDPERFAADAPRPERFAYLPFGRGMHQCLGREFALLEGQILMETLGRRWHAELLEPRLPEPLPLVTLRVQGGLPVRLHRRRD